MNKLKSSEDWQSKARNFVKEYILPNANKYSLDGKIPPDFLKCLTENRFLGMLISPNYNGIGLNYITYGLITEEFGYGCSSIRSLLTVHDMVSLAIETFGNDKQKIEWLPRLAEGSIIAAFALTEPRLGSSIDKITTYIKQHDQALFLYGKKVWISYGQIADLLLVFAKFNNEPVAILLPRNSKNLRIKPIQNSLGMSASMLAEIHMDGVEIDRSQILGPEGAGLRFIANTCLILGRYSVAYGSCGIIRACMEACKKRVLDPRPDGSLLINHQIIAGMMTDIVAAHKVTSLLCKNAGMKLQSNFYAALKDIMIAKYLGAKNAYETASNALQIYGADGYNQDSPLRRWLHDAKVSELIEGSNEVMKGNIGKLFLSD